MLVDWCSLSEVYSDYFCFLIACRYYFSYIPSIRILSFFRIFYQTPSHVYNVYCTYLLVVFRGARAKTLGKSRATSSLMRKERTTKKETRSKTMNSLLLFSSSSSTKIHSSSSLILPPFYLLTPMYVRYFSCPTFIFEKSSFCLNGLQKSNPKPKQ